MPTMYDDLSELGAISPYDLHRILRISDEIHDHYRMGIESDGPDTYYLAREMDKLSRRIRRIHNQIRPFSQAPSLASWADQLHYMARDMQIGPRRLRHYTMPKRRRMISW
ncbi:hypothetical protein ACN47E_001094 [Coniothyrium glycines]